jgi:hypothetical protein
MKKIDMVVSQILTKLYKKQGNIMAELIVNWEKITGNRLSMDTRPMRIRSQLYKGKKIDILYISVTDSSKALEISYSENLILERIAIFLGKKTIQRVLTHIINDSAL